MVTHCNEYKSIINRKLPFFYKYGTMKIIALILIIIICIGNFSFNESTIFRIECLYTINDTIYSTGNYNPIVGNYNNDEGLFSDSTNMIGDIFVPVEIVDKLGHNQKYILKISDKDDTNENISLYDSSALYIQNRNVYKRLRFLISKDAFYHNIEKDGYIVILLEKRSLADRIYKSLR